jgi:hypothetical protein
MPGGREKIISEALFKSRTILESDIMNLNLEKLLNISLVYENN